MADNKKFDLIVIGGGPGGYVAAIRAAQLGLKVAVIEREHLGGICLNWGCIPTKALLRVSEVYGLMHRANEFGLKCANISFDIKKIVEYSRGVAKQLSGGVEHLLKKNKIEHIKGEGKLTDKESVQVTGKDGKKSMIHAEHIIIATGAKPRSLPGLEFDGNLILNYKDAMIPTEFPKTLLIIGGGAIGIEFASFYNSFGAKVTVVEMQENILPVEDEEISDMLKKSLEKHGIKIHNKSSAKILKKNKDNVEVELNIDGSIEKHAFDKIIVAAGVSGNVEDIGLEALGIKIDRGHVAVDEFCRTACKNIFAIGDVANPPWLAHKASHEGVMCAEIISGKKDVHAIDASNIPSCTYCHPQVASVGLTEKKAKEDKYDIRIGRFPYAGNGKAIALGESEGLVKVIFGKKTGEILGAHIIGEDATEIIHSYVVGKSCELTDEDFRRAIFAHPTLSEMIHESSLSALDGAIHS